MRRLAVFLTLTVLAASSSILVTAPASAASSSARDVLQKLTVAAESNTPAYDRDKFKHWIDADRDGCNTRYEVLIAEATTKPKVSSSCWLSGGKWKSAFDGATTTNPSAFDVDHMVPLKEAWISGASKWSAAQRQAFANDLDFPHSLIAVSASSNRSKGASDPASWMPLSSSYHCTYAKNWVLVKYRWGLSIDTAERDKLSSLLSGKCGSNTVTLPTVMIGKASATSHSPATKAVRTPIAQFSDIYEDSMFKTEIVWLANSGVTTGYADKTFRPHAPITRDAMAAFMYRLAGEPSYTPPKYSEFTDITPNSKFYKEIMWLSSTGVTTGYADGTFRPYASVTRDAMAAFMYRLAGQPSFTAPKHSPFSDMTPRSKFFRETAWLADTGVSTGWAADKTYRPFLVIERNAMAAFMHRFERSVGADPGLTPRVPAKPPVTTKPPAPAKPPATVKPPTTVTPPAPAKPANPGDTKNCTDFTRWSDAQAWHDRHFPYYGDVSRLDRDGDGVVCESLPGAP